MEEDKGLYSLDDIKKHLDVIYRSEFKSFLSNNTEDNKTSQLSQEDEDIIIEMEAKLKLTDSDFLQLQNLLDNTCNDLELKIAIAAIQGDDYSQIFKELLSVYKLQLEYCEAAKTHFQGALRYYLLLESLESEENDYYIERQAFYAVQRLNLETKRKRYLRYIAPPGAAWGSGNISGGE